MRIDLPSFAICWTPHHACHYPPALVLLLLHFPPHSHFPMLEQWQGSKWLPRQQWWTSARSQEKKLNLSNLASESGTCFSRISKTSRTSSLVNLNNAHACRCINKGTFLLPNLWIKHCYLEKGLLLFQRVALYCILMSEKICKCYEGSLNQSCIAMINTVGCSNIKWCNSVLQPQNIWRAVVSIIIYQIQPLNINNECWNCKHSFILTGVFFHIGTKLCTLAAHGLYVVVGRQHLSPGASSSCL